MDLVHGPGFFISKAKTCIYTTEWSMMASARAQDMEKTLDNVEPALGS